MISVSKSHDIFGYLQLRHCRSPSRRGRQIDVLHPSVRSVEVFAKHLHQFLIVVSLPSSSSQRRYFCHLFHPLFLIEMVREEVYNSLIPFAHELLKLPHLWQHISSESICQFSAGNPLRLFLFSSTSNSSPARTCFALSWQTFFLKL